MTVNKNIQELSIKQLFQNENYTIPIYQRNYAWSEPEVEQLIQDVLDSATSNEQESYYIGSLVVFQRKDLTFEIIDGQQRHTTLCILLSALKNKYSQDLNFIKINLNFDSRPKSAKTLFKLFNNLNANNDEAEEKTIRAAYEISNRYLNKEKTAIDEFTNYLLNKVKILRIVVPEDTDLNHYFEIMNNRGEQLEKHEVLKVQLMSQLNDAFERNTFSKIWDACAEMNRYVQFGFDSDTRNKVFGLDWNTYPKTFNDLSEKLNHEKQDNFSQSLSEIINASKFDAEVLESKNKPELGSFGSVINFSNFLLHVLRVSTKKDIPLDDKRLLDTFATHDPDPRQFVMDILKCRMLFDRYIIKRENEENWSLKTLRLYKKEKQSVGYVNTAEDENKNRQLIMLLSMFHISFPAFFYKHWLSAALRHLYTNTKETDNISIDNYIKKLELISDRFYYGRFGISNSQEPTDYFTLCFDKDAELPQEINLTHLAQGTNVQNFIFNRLDYLLWKRLSDKEIFPNIKMGYIQKRFEHFSFTFRTSVEHYFPQNPRTGNMRLEKSDALPTGCDTFGNLCLISHSSNSKLNNLLPTAKKEYYEKATTIESLKQVFMMSYPNWGPENPEVIAEHERMMIEILQ